MEEIRRFNGDIRTKEALKQYFEAFIAEECVRMAYERKDVSHIADAKELLDKVFTQIEIDYAIPTQQGEQTNQAK